MSFSKLPFKIDVSRMRQYLESHPEVFGEYSERTISGPHSRTTDIWLRYNDYSNIGEHFNDMHFPVWYPRAFDVPNAIDIPMTLMAAVEGEHLGGVIVTKLPAGESIDPHIDFGWHTEFYDKFYIAVKNEPGARLCFDSGCIEPEEGDIYWFENTVKHWVENTSNCDRIALIVCIRTLQRSLYGDSTNR